MSPRSLILSDERVLIFSLNAAAKSIYLNGWVYNIGFKEASRTLFRAGRSVLPAGAGRSGLIRFFRCERLAPHATEEGSD